MFYGGIRSVFPGVLCALFLAGCDDGAPALSEDIDPQNIASVALGDDIDWDKCRNPEPGRPPYVFNVMANFTLQLQKMRASNALSQDDFNQAVLQVQQANLRVANGDFDGACAILQELAGSME